MTLCVAVNMLKVVDVISFVSITVRVSRSGITVIVAVALALAVEVVVVVELSPIGIVGGRRLSEIYADPLAVSPDIALTAV